jgi:hypothetical protein
MGMVGNKTRVSHSKTNMGLFSRKLVRAWNKYFYVKDPSEIRGAFHFFSFLLSEGLYYWSPCHRLQRARIVSVSYHAWPEICFWRISEFPESNWRSHLYKDMCLYLGREREREKKKRGDKTISRSVAGIWENWACCSSLIAVRVET